MKSFKYKLLFLAIILCQIAYSQIETENGLIAYYTFNGDATDKSVNNFNGDVIGAKLSYDRFGNSNCAYYFDGIDDFIYFKKKNFAKDNNVSVSIWIKPIEKSNSLYFANCSDFGLFQRDKRIGIAISLPNTNSAGGEVNKFGDWQHLVGAFDGTYIKVYINGKFVSKTLHKGNISDSERFLTLGKFSLNSDGYWSGYLDEMRIYNRVISDKEIQSLYKTNNTLIDVDQNIPTSTNKKYNTYALIIGNEDYNSYQLDLTNEVNVNYAENDAKVFKEYAINVLGIPEENITYLINAKAIEMHRAIDKMSLLAKNLQGEGELILYYAGHGFPDEITKEPYLIPVDVSGSDLRFAVKLKDVYAKLTEYQTKRVTVFLDACFSGGTRNQGLLATRGVKIKPKSNLLSGNLIVITSSSGEQSSLAYKDKQHGLFTYFLLKKIQDTRGDLTYGELSDYLIKQVGIKSVMIYNKEQNPKTNVSLSIQNEWRSWKIR